MRIRSILVHVVQAFTEGALIALLVVGLIAGTAFAGNGGGPNKSSSSISLVMVGTSGVTTSTSDPSYGDTVTFNVSTTATTQPYVHLKCFQSGTLVLEAWQAWFEGGLGTRTFPLGTTPAWQGGAADCTAYLENWDSYSKNGRTTVLASTSFHVNG
jgi:hypothetical protein